MVIALLKRTKPGRRIDKDYLEAKGIPKNAIYPSLSSLRFFNLINQNGDMTPLASEFLKNRKKRTDIIQSAYKPLFDKLKLPIDHRSEIMGAIAKISQIGEKLLPFCTTFFIWAAKEAGHVPLKQTAKRAPRAGGRPRGRKPGAAWHKAPAALAAFTFQFSVTPTTSLDQVKKMIATVKKALEES
jgi:hypothetical protein